jgi:hypothetical protein
MQEAEEAARKAALALRDQKGGLKITLGDGGGNLTIKSGGPETVVAKGTPGPFEQKGEFRAYRSTTGNVFFPIPYEKPPQVELKVKLGLHDVEIVDVKTTGFKWKNNGKREFLDEPDMLFTARGVPVAGQEQTPLTQKAEFKANSGATGEEKFAQAYAAPPHIEMAVKFGLHKVVITETTATGFKWRNEGKRGFVDNCDMTYTARGVKAK